MELNDLLRKQGFAPEHVLVFRHRPAEPRLRRVLPRLARRRPDLFNAYQSTQGPRVERAMQRAGHIAAFVGEAAGFATFAGLYIRRSERVIRRDEFWQTPGFTELRELGMEDLQPDRESVVLFDLIKTPFYDEWASRLIVAWPGPELSWWRWADRNVIPVHAIREVDDDASPPPPWREWSITWEELALLPNRWQAALREWRGVYFILDRRDGKGYVGSAGGASNLLGRWMEYARTGHGGNIRLLDRDPTSFVFTILERVSPDMPLDEVVRVENSWKERLHTREYGLNVN